MSVFPTKTCEIKEYVEGHTDTGTGQWVNEGYRLVATAEVDIQSKSGQQRASELKTEYESDYVGFVDIVDITFETGYSEIKKGYNLFGPDNTEYIIVFPGKWSDHYELELKENG